MKDKIIIPNYDFNVNNSCGALERIMHDQKKLPHLLQRLPIKKDQIHKEEDTDSLLVITDKGLMTHYSNGTFKETDRKVK